MSKSFWMEEQNGNFSNNQEDTFNPGKKYVGVRLQQGVPLLDRDWNELEDMRRYEEMILRKWYVGNGVPDADSFKISAAAPPDNDFKIANGICMVEGFGAVNGLPGEVGFILYSQQEGVAPLTVPITPTRTDIVYLDVWIEEVTSDEDAALGNSQDVNIETCIRHKLEWRIRVDEGNNGYTPEAFHHYYDIARIERKGGGNIKKAEIVDLRRTELALHHLKDVTAQHWHSKLVGADGSPDPALSVDNNGNVGIGTAGPTQALSIGAGNVLLPTANQGSDGNLYFGGITNIGEVGLRLFGGVVNGTIPAGFIDIKTTEDNDGLRIRVDKVEGATERMRITATGNVGIGTASPGEKLEVSGGVLKITNDGNGTVLLDLNTERNWQFRQLGTGPGTALELASVGGGGNKNFIINTNGNVGIGTTPSEKLHINGSVRGNQSGALRISTGYGYVDIGPKNSSWSHFYTDRARFYFDKEIRVNSGLIGSYDENLYLRTSENTRMTIVNSSGNVGIGTTTPGAPLEVQKTGGSGEMIDLLILDSNNAGLHGGGALVFKGIGTQPERAKIGATYQGNINGDLRFYTKPNYNIALTEQMRISPDGDVWARSRSGGAIDYAEYFESIDSKKIPSGTPVILDGDKIRAAKKKENPIGIISANPGIAGGVHIEWPKKYLRDEFGNLILEEDKEKIMKPKTKKVKKKRQKIKRKKVKEEVTRTEIVLKKGKYCQKEITEKVTRQVEEPVFKEIDLYNASGKKIIGKHQVPVMETYEEEIEVLDENDQPVMVGTGKFVTKECPKLNPKYDESKEYIPREKRPEWNCVGLLGQLPLRKGQPVAPTWVKIKSVSKDVDLWLVK